MIVRVKLKVTPSACTLILRVLVWVDAEPRLPLFEKETVIVPSALAVPFVREKENPELEASSGTVIVLATRVMPLRA